MKDYIIKPMVILNEEERSETMERGRLFKYN